jgi:site-specific DNA-methyltransferase (adenine-specific)
MKIVIGDCVDVLAGMPAASVRLVVADPPYGIGLNYGDHYDDNIEDGAYRAFTRRWLAACARVLTPDGSVWVIVNADRGWMVCAEATDGAGLRLHQQVIWRETFGVNCTGKFNLTHRALLWLCGAECRQPVFNREAVNRPSDRQLKYNDRRANPKGKNWDSVWLHLPARAPEAGEDIWTVSRVCGTFGERLIDAKIRSTGRQLTQLPLDLIRPIVGACSDRGDLVVDPFAGTGVTAIACAELARDHVGIELSAETASVARRRLLRHLAERA